MAATTTEHSQDSLDTLSSACYTIPWRPKRKAKATGARDGDACFPILADFEVDDAPARVRYQSYRLAVQQIDSVFDECIHQAFSTLFQDLRVFFHPNVDQDDETTLRIDRSEFFLPGLESNDQERRTSSSIQTALLISSSAPWLSSFSNRLVSHVANRTGNGVPNVIVTLGALECTNLHTALRLLVSRFIAQACALAPFDSEVDARLTSIEIAASSGKIEPDLNLLRRWWAARFGHVETGPAVVLNIPAVEAVEPTVLADLLSALQAFVSEYRAEDTEIVSKAPAVTLILGITSPSGGLTSALGSGASSSAAPAPWIDYIPRQVLRVLDISRFALPSRESIWSQLVHSFLISRHLPVSLGPSTFEFVRQIYWEKDADLDSVLDAVRLACFLHFSGKPESVFALSGLAAEIHSSSWTPKMIERIRASFLAADSTSETLTFPCLLDRDDEDDRFDPDAFLNRIQSSDFLMHTVDRLSHTRQVLGFRLELAARFLSRAYEALQKIQSRATSAAQALQARNLSSSAIAAAAVAAQQVVELEEQRQTERVSENLTQVVSQCLLASVGSLDSDEPPPNVLLLSSGLARLCNAARRLLSDEFEALLDDLVSLAEDEVTNMQDAAADVRERRPGRLHSASQIITAQSEEFLAGLRTFQQKLAQTIAAGRAGLKEENELNIPHPAVSGETTGAQQKREARLQRVQRNLLMEEKLLGLKREITNWIIQSITDMVDWKDLPPGPLGLLRDIFWIDSYDPLSTLLDPSARAGLTLPLTEPMEFLESLHDAAASVSLVDALPVFDLSTLKKADSPDICRIYRLYRECGKFVNLADWYDAFKQSIELDSALKTTEQTEDEIPSPQEVAVVSDDAQLGLTGNDSASNDGGSEDDDVDDDAFSGERGKRQTRAFDLMETSSPSKRRKGTVMSRVPHRAERASAGTSAQIQARFALAINELARMGMLRGTRRRAEHITKVMWDLVPESF